MPMRLALFAAFIVAFGVAGHRAVAMPGVPSVERGAPLLVPAQMPLFELFSSDDDYVHDRHYDWNQYRNSTSRKERVRDYYRMQNEVQKDYWRAQKNMQKEMIKRQRGW
jgi:hypothetical protein